MFKQANLFAIFFHLLYSLIVMKRVFKNLIKFFCLCLTCVFSVSFLAGCDTGFRSPSQFTAETFDQMVNEAKKQAAKEVADSFKSNFNGIKIVYLPDQADSQDVSGQFALLTGVSRLVVDKLKESYSSGIVNQATFYWRNKSDSYKLSPVVGENYHYTSTVGGTTKYFYINPNADSNKYYYNTTATYEFDSGNSVSLTLYTNEPYVDADTTLIAGFEGLENKLTATFVNSALNLSGTDAISTDVDGSTSAYAVQIRNKLASFEYFGLKDEDIAAGKAYILSLIPEIKGSAADAFDEAFLAEIFDAAADVLALLSPNNVKTYLLATLGAQWQLNIQIENCTMEDLNAFIEDGDALMGARKYLSIVYMTKSTYLPYYNKDVEDEKNATTNLFPSECSFVFDSGEGGEDITATFYFKAAGDLETYEAQFSVTHNGDVYEAEDGTQITYTGKNAVELQSFTNFDDVENVITLNTAFTTENDETANGSGWGGVVKIFNGTSFNKDVASCIVQIENKFMYVSATHDVMQVVFDKTDSFDLGGIGSLSLDDATQIDLEALKELIG